MKEKIIQIAHSAQLKIMDEIHRVCEKKGLRYYLIGGSALGAIRHNGFIPWDLDIDIAMPRPDYEAFLKIAKEELADSFSILDYERKRSFFPPHALVILKNSSFTYDFTPLNPNLSCNEIYVDVLPLDTVSDNRRDQIIHARDLRLVSKIKYLKASRIYPKNSLVTRLVKMMLRLLFLPVSWRFLNRLQQSIAMRHSNMKDSLLCCSTLSHYKYDKLTMPFFVFGTPKLYEFEGRMYYGPEDIFTYLQQIFGNYMELPRQDEREKQIASVIDVRIGS